MIWRANGGKRNREAGVTIVFIGLGLVMLLAVAGLAIDLATLYVARSEAQRAADAAALAGAEEFVTTSYSNGLMTAAQVQMLAAQQATQIGNNNLIIGRSPDLDAGNFSGTCPPSATGSGGCFNFINTSDPRITVVVQKAMPTYFMKVVGVTTVSVSATATAEAYTPSGSTPPVTTQCLKPWLLPNCDPDHPVAQGDPEANQNCKFTSGPYSGQYAENFVDPNTNTLAKPGLTPSGVVGEPLVIKPGNPQSNTISAPSQFWPVFLPTNGVFECPNCASADQQNSTSNSAALYRENIECCSTLEITCGTNTVNPIQGDMTGPTGQGVDCLIHQGNQGTGQDTISLDSSLASPFQVYAGANNPYGFTSGTPISTSDSLVILPIYDGTPLCPGNSCPSGVQVSVIGFIQMFIVNEGPPQNSVNAYVLSVSPCTSGANVPGTTSVPATAGSPIPVRLIHN
ncbi:MAG TPA: pilus assembly protein TadG-related protein [Candidatus Acidoferrales bacterium]|nr:pilus assembly protein TadG-related protein [Candidatus Acidoferrales bacterium]